MRRFICKDGLSDLTTKYKNLLESGDSTTVFELLRSLAKNPTLSNYNSLVSMYQLGQAPTKLLKPEEVASAGYEIGEFERKIYVWEPQYEKDPKTQKMRKTRTIPAPRYDLSQMTNPPAPICTLHQVEFDLMRKYDIDMERVEEWTERVLVREGKVLYISPKTTQGDIDDLSMLPIIEIIHPEFDYKELIAAMLVYRYSDFDAPIMKCISQCTVPGNPFVVDMKRIDIRAVIKEYKVILDEIYKVSYIPRIKDQPKQKESNETLEGGGLMSYTTGSFLDDVVVPSDYGIDV